MIRKLLERVSRERVLRRRLPSTFARTPLYVSPDSALGYWRRDLTAIGQELFDFAEHVVRPGHEVWDVGANVGLFSVAAAERAGASGQVTAFEPDLFLVSLLRRTAAEAFGGERLEVLPVAVGRAPELLSFHIAARGRSSSHLDLVAGNSQSGGTRARVPVPAVTLDWVLERRPAPDVVKIDVEGAELEVLHGATRVLAEARPVLLCEVGERNAHAAAELLQAHGYELHDWSTRTSAPTSQACYSTLAVPSERGLLGSFRDADAYRRAGFV